MNAREAREANLATSAVKRCDMYAGYRIPISSLVLHIYAYIAQTSNLQQHGESSVGSCVLCVRVRSADGVE